MLCSNLSVIEEALGSLCMTTEIINKGLPAPFQKHYRPDIDGLRAIAVLSVVGYHFTSGRFHGGFIGVDIFFVISGFLITSNIVEDLDRTRFSFLDFYARRIRRIFPALAIILVFTYFVGLLTFNRLNEYFDLYPISPFVRVLGSIAAGAGFSSNLFFWHSTAYFGNYFGETPLSEPLLHLWSLGIEEQFYIVWPLLLYFAHKHKSNYFIAALLIGIVSFGINICTVHQHPVAAFYSPLSRSWELMVGAVLALTPPLGRHVFALGSKQLSVAGLALIAFGLFFVTDTMAFPGWVALLPTLGAACCIAAGPSPWLNRNILGNRAFVWIGLISYPLYLWHWPALYIYEKYATPLISSYDVFRLAKLAALLICVVVSWLTFVLVERPVWPVPGSVDTRLS